MKKTTKLWLGGLALFALLCIVGGRYQDGPVAYYYSASQTYHNGQQVPLLTDVNGNLLVNVASGGGGGGSSGKAVTLLANSMSGSPSGLYITGAHKIGRIAGDNGTSSTLYLQLFDATSLPSNGSSPIAEVTVTFGIATSPTENKEDLTPDYIQTTTGVFVAWSTTPGTLTVVGSGTNLTARIYGN